MKKIPLIQVLTQFYKPHVMKYVGSQWKGNGLLLLFGLSVYASIFIGYAWAKYIENNYAETFQPTLELLPETTYSQGVFTFEGIEMPHEVVHPLTKKPVFYIDTRSNEVDDSAADYACIISQSGISLTQFHIPIIPEHSDFYEMFIQPTKGPVGQDETLLLTGADIVKSLNNSIKQTVYFTFIVSTIATFFGEAMNILIISFIILIMVRKGRQIRNFKQLMRLCILTYIPTFTVYAVYKFYMSQPGIFVTIMVSITHIILFMRAVVANFEQPETPSF